MCLSSYALAHPDCHSPAGRRDPTSKPCRFPTPLSVPSFSLTSSSSRSPLHHRPRRAMTCCPASVLSLDSPVSRKRGSRGLSGSCFPRPGSTRADQRLTASHVACRNGDFRSLSLSNVSLVSKQAKPTSSALTGPSPYRTSTISLSSTSLSPTRPPPPCSRRPPSRLSPPFTSHSVDSSFPRLFSTPSSQPSASFPGRKSKPTSAAATAASKASTSAYGVPGGIRQR